MFLFCSRLCQMKLSTRRKNREFSVAHTNCLMLCFTFWCNSNLFWSLFGVLCSLFCRMKQLNAPLWVVGPSQKLLIIELEKVYDRSHSLSMYSMLICFGTWAQWIHKDKLFKPLLVCSHIPIWCRLWLQSSKPIKSKFSVIAQSLHRYGPRTWQNLLQQVLMETTFALSYFWSSNQHVVPHQDRKSLTGPPIIHRLWLSTATILFLVGLRITWSWWIWNLR